MKEKIMTVQLYRRVARVFLSQGLAVALLLTGGCASLTRKQAREPFTVVVLPDTQCYADVRDKWTQSHFKIPDQRSCFYAQTQWIKNNRRDHNIVMVAHVGDIVQYDDPEEWKISVEYYQRHT